MNLLNPVWHLSRSLHPLADAHLRLIPYEPRNPAFVDHCAFCDAVFQPAPPGALPLLAFASTAGHWVCQSCHCEHKDDFNWPSSE